MIVTDHLINQRAKLQFSQTLNPAKLRRTALLSQTGEAVSTVIDGDWTTQPLICPNFDAIGPSALACPPDVAVKRRGSPRDLGLENLPMQRQASALSKSPQSNSQTHSAPVKIILFPLSLSMSNRCRPYADDDIQNSPPFQFSSSSRGGGEEARRIKSTGCKLGD